MSKQNCYVSVQWGKGMHYFIGGPLSRTDALLCADGHIKGLKRRLRARGALPTVRVFKVTAEVRITRKRKGDDG